MKTAKTAGQFLDDQPYGFSSEHKECIIKAMQAYAAQESRKAAIEAIEKCAEVARAKATAWVDKESILKIKEEYGTGIPEGGKDYEGEKDSLKES